MLYEVTVIFEIQIPINLFLSPSGHLCLSFIENMSRPGDITENVTHPSIIRLF